MPLDSCTRYEIGKEWLKLRKSARDLSIVKFECRDINDVCVDGYWTKERDQKRARDKKKERESSGELKSHRDLQSPQSTTVLFPGQARGMDQEIRPLWYFRRALFKRSADCFSFEDLDCALCKLIDVDIGTIELERDVDILDNALGLLSRLPETPLELPSLPSPPESSEPGRPSWEKIDAGKPFWESLTVVRQKSKTVIWMALAIAATWDRNIGMNAKARESLDFSKFANRLSEIIDAATNEIRGANNGHQEWRWFIVKAFLWSTWQRCVSLHYWSVVSSTRATALADRYRRILQDQLAIGFDYQDLAELTLRPNLESAAASEKQIDRKPDYMCTLAYRLLSRSKSTSMLDLREFHESFEKLFGKRKGRCSDDGSCKGDSPANCKRIKGAQVIDQSQHDRLCCDCMPMKWDESSYRSLSGARAVSIAGSTVDGRIQYERASPKTIAISHVWSHGQGGRPESGLNSCLHNRYKKIAKEFECTSYWIDAACIPTPHDLRWEAIMTINGVFLGSKIVLVCDKDLMEIDVSVILNSETSMTTDAVALRESILATLLVCDWNIRAWTLLEALRGRAHIFLLCKSGSENAYLSLKEILQVVSSHGRINIGILMLTNYQLLPSPDPRDWLQRNTIAQTAPSQAHVRRWQHRGIFYTSHDAMKMAERVGHGFVSVSEAASLLVHRFASRSGDDVIIWSLLVGKNAIKEASSLWKECEKDHSLTGGSQPVGNARVYTSFLLSEAPRLTEVGLRWAPSQPGLPLERISEQSLQFPAYDGSMSRTGVIETTVPYNYSSIHLRAEWGVSRIKFCNGRPSAYDVSTAPQLHAFVEESLNDGGYSEGALLQSLQEDIPEVDVYAREEVPQRRYALASLYKGPSQGPLFVLCGKKQGHEKAWTWLGVFDWGVQKPLPVFFVQEVLLN